MKNSKVDRAFAVFMWLCFIAAAGIFAYIVADMVYKVQQYEKITNDIQFSRCIHHDLTEYNSNFEYNKELGRYEFEAISEEKRLFIAGATAPYVKALVVYTYCK